MTPETLGSAERDEPPQQRLARASRRARAEPDPDPVGPLPRPRDLERLGDRVVGVLRDAGAQRGLVEIAAAVGDPARQDRPDAGLLDRARQSRQVVAAEDERLRERRRAGLQHLEDREAGRRAHVGRRVGALEDEDALGHPAPERDLVGAAAQHGLRKVDVAVDEPGHEQAAALVAHLVGWVGGADVGPLAHGHDGGALHGDRAVGDDPALGVHRDDRGVREDHVDPSRRSSLSCQRTTRRSTSVTIVKRTTPVSVAVTRPAHTRSVRYRTCMSTM